MNHTPSILNHSSAKDSTINTVQEHWFQEFWKYVNRGYYQQFLRDLEKTKSKEELIAINKMIREVYVGRLQRSKHVLGKVYLGNDASTVFIEHEHILREQEPTFTRLMVGNHGMYVEFDKPANKGSLIKQRLQYNEYNRNGVKLYDQFKTVNYADYKAGKWYASLRDYKVLVT